MWRAIAALAYFLKVLGQSIEGWREERYRKAVEKRRADVLADPSAEWMRRFNEQQTGSAPEASAGKQQSER